MTYRERQVPSDQELEALLADTRALLAEKSRWENDQINRDLDGLLHRVRGAKRVSYSQVMRQRGQSWQENLDKTAASLELENSPHLDSLEPPYPGHEQAPDKLADQLARSEAAISKQSRKKQSEDLDNPEDILESVDEIPPEAEHNF